MTQKEFKIEGMTCHHCVKAVVIELNKLNVESHQIDIGTAFVSFDELKIKEDDVVKAIEEAGYKVIRRK